MSFSAGYNTDNFIYCILKKMVLFRCLLNSKEDDIIPHKFWLTKETNPKIGLTELVYIYMIYYIA